MHRKPAQVAPPRLTPADAATAAFDAADVRLARQRRTEHERRVAMALQQPQGLGLLFPGLRGKR